MGLAGENLKLREKIQEKKIISICNFLLVSNLPQDSYYSEP